MSHFPVNKLSRTLKLSNSKLLSYKMIFSKRDMYIKCNKNDFFTFWECSTVNFSIINDLRTYKSFCPIMQVFHILHIWYSFEASKNKYKFNKLDSLTITIIRCSFWKQDPLQMLNLLIMYCKLLDTFPSKISQ